MPAFRDAAMNKMNDVPLSFVDFHRDLAVILIFVSCLCSLPQPHQQGMQAWKAVYQSTKTIKKNNKANNFKKMLLRMR